MSAHTELQKLVGSVLMFGFRGDSLDNPETREDVAALKAIHCQGVILFDHDLKANGPRNIQSPKQLAKLIDDLHNELGEDLIVAIDQEGGSVARLNEHNGFRPTISAQAFAQLVEIDQIQYADQQAQQLAELGIDLNFAPCVDLAIEPDSPIIAAKERSFGRTIEQVHECARLVIEAHQRFGVRCCIKHFPGHGSSLLDSHKDVCDITRSHRPSEQAIFGELIERFGESIAIMIGHLMITSIDPDFPASLSIKLIGEGLRSKYDFAGVVVTDSLDMRAIRKGFGEGESAVRAISAGADLILDGLNAPGYRQPGAPQHLAQAIYQSITQHRLANGEEKLIESRARLDRFFGRTNDQRPR